MRQLWINYGRSADEMVIGWLTAEVTASSIVEFGTASGAYDSTASGTNTSYTYSASYTSGLIHHTTLTCVVCCGDDSFQAVPRVFGSACVHVAGMCA